MTTLTTEHEVAPLRVASAREWRAHVAHEVSRVGVFVRACCAFVGSLALWTALMSSSQFVTPTLALLLDPHVTGTQSMSIVGSLAGFALVAIGLAVLIWRVAWTAVHASVTYLIGDLRQLARTLTRGFEASQDEAANVGDAMLVVLSGICAIAGGVWWTVMAGRDILAQGPPEFGPWLMLIVLTAGSIMLWFALVRLVPVQRVAMAVGTLVPALRGTRLPVPRRLSCLVCANVRDERPLGRRVARSVRRWAASMLGWLAAHSAWGASLHANSRRALGLAAGLAWFMGAAAVGVDLGPALILLAVAGWFLATWCGIYLYAEFILDDLPKTRLSSVCLVMIVCAIGAALVLGDVYAMVGTVNWLGRQLEGRVRFDANMAMLTLLCTQVCIVYAGYATLARRRGREVRWTPREVLVGSVLQLLGLGASSLSASWYPTMVLLVASVLGAHSRPGRGR